MKMFYNPNQVHKKRLKLLLSEDELRKRGRIAFEWARKNNKPIVWNLAGGYTEMNKVVSLHNITMQECLQVYKPSK